MKDFDTYTNEEKVDLFLALSKMIKYRMMEEESLKLVNESLDASFNSDKIEDGEYLYLLQKILTRDDNEQLIISQAQRRIENSKTQCACLSEFKPKYREIKKFCLQEKERLERFVPTSEIEIKEDSRIFSERLEEKKRLEIKKKVDLLINIHDKISGKSEIRPLQLTIEKFLLLIKEYASEAFILKSESKDEDNIRSRLDKISNVIDYNKNSLDLSGDIKDNPELRLNVIKLLYATCYTGDYKTFKTLFEKLGDKNMQTIFFSSIPIKKTEEDKKGLITLEGMTKIISKRLTREEMKKTPNQNQIDGWTEVAEKMQQLADDTLAQLRSSEGIAGMSLAKDDDGGPAARSTRPRDAGSAERVDRRDEMPKKDGGPSC